MDCSHAQGASVTGKVHQMKTSNTQMTGREKKATAEVKH